ncbi:MAG: hypothetical protein AB7E52_03570 [Bdellovibrionales bacterium]
MMKHGLFILTLMMGSLALASPALAKKPDHEMRKEMYERSYEEYRGPETHRDRQPQMPQRTIARRFSDHDRSYIQAYQMKAYGKHCPPGQAKKGRCYSSKESRYVIGGVLPPTYRAVPDALRVEMGAPPPGTFYAMVDSDVLLVTEATKKILDAVTLLSAMH